MEAGGHSWRRVARTRDDRPYTIRPIDAQDAQRDREFLMNLSEGSRYRRMMGACREPSAALIDRLVHVDRHASMAFAAVIGPNEAETIIGVARYSSGERSSDAEFAIAVADEWQSCGVGSALMQVLCEYARSQGVRRLHGLAFTSNGRMLQLADKFHFASHRMPGDSTLLRLTRDL